MTVSSPLISDATAVQTYYLHALMLQKSLFACLNYLIQTCPGCPCVDKTVFQPSRVWLNSSTSPAISAKYRHSKAWERVLMLGLFIKASLRPNYRVRLEVRKRARLWKAEYPSWDTNTNSHSTVAMRIRSGLVRIKAVPNFSLINMEKLQ